jgi:heme exporter protein D
MNWGSLSDFLHMGGYGFYVWSSYGMCAALIGVELWSARARRRRAVAEAQRVAARGDA